MYLNGLIVGAGNAGHSYPDQILRDQNKTQSSIDTILGDAMPGLSPTMRVLYSTPHNSDYSYSFTGNTGALARPTLGFSSKVFLDLAGVAPTSAARTFSTLPSTTSPNYGEGWAQAAKGKSWIRNWMRLNNWLSTLARTPAHRQRARRKSRMVPTT